MTKLKAFTLIELLVAMVVSGIVIAVAYQVYLIATMQFSEYKRISDKVTSEVVLKGLLNSDFFMSESVIQRSENSIEVQRENKAIRYEWNERYVLRTTENMKDTFFLEVASAELMFNNEKRQRGELIDEMKLVSKESGQERIFCFFKHYSADVLLRNENVIE